MDRIIKNAVRLGVKQKGFTLIEMMVVITITLIMTVGTGLMGNYWSNNSKASTAQSQLLESVSRAKALALRNSTGVLSGNAVISLNNAQGLLTLCAGNTTNCTAPLWQGTLPSNATITSGGTALVCMMWDNQAMPVVMNKCSTSASYTITAGSVSITGSL